jgi:preprotein translocase subunit SecD
MWWRAARTWLRGRRTGCANPRARGAIRFNANATSRLSRATRDNVGQILAIVLDGELIAASVIREPIADGAARLSGGLTLLQARDLATLLRAGTLPLPVTIVERQIVEP